MPRPRFAYPTRLLKRPIRQAIAQVAESGIEGIQLDARNELRATELSETGIRQFLHYLKEHQVSVSSLTFPIRRSLSDSDQLDGRIAAIKDAMSFAARLQCQVVTTRAGVIPTDTESTEFKTLVDALNDLARHGNHVGAILTLTTSGVSLDARSQLFERIDQGPIGVELDPAGVVTSGGKVDEFVQAFHASIRHVRVRDAVRDMDGTSTEVPVGRGEVDWEELLALLDEAAYPGWMTVDRTSGDDPAGDAGRAIQYLNQIQLG